MKQILAIMVCLMAILGFLEAQTGLYDRVGELSTKIAQKMTDNQKTTVAVMEFTDLKGNVTDFGRFLAEETITKLFETGKFKVIERQMLNKVIKEQQLSLTGVVDPESAKKLGKILGVDAICSGTISDLAQNLRVNARMINTETGEVFAVASVEIFKDENVMRLLSNNTSNVTSTSPTTQDTPKEEQKYIERVFRELGVTIQLVGYTKNSSELVVDFIMIANKDIEVVFSGSYVIFDDGNRYDASLGIIANKINQMDTQLIGGIPTKASLKFPVQGNMSKVIAILKVGLRYGFIWNYDYVDFRNIQLN